VFIVLVGVGGVGGSLSKVLVHNYYFKDLYRYF